MKVSSNLTRNGRKNEITYVLNSSSHQFIDIDNSITAQSFSAFYAIEVVGTDHPTFLQLALNGTLVAAPEDTVNEPDEFLRLMSESDDGSILLWSKNGGQFISTMSGCKKFHANYQTDSDRNQFTLVSACDDDAETRIEFGNLNKFRWIDAPLFLYYVVYEKEGGAYFIQKADVPQLTFPVDAGSEQPLLEVIPVEDTPGNYRFRVKGTSADFCFGVSDSRELISEYSGECKFPFGVAQIPSAFKPFTELYPDRSKSNFPDPDDLSTTVALDLAVIKKVGFPSIRPSALVLRPDQFGKFYA